MFLERPVEAQFVAGTQEQLFARVGERVQPHARELFAADIVCSAGFVDRRDRVVERLRILPVRGRIDRVPEVETGFVVDLLHGWEIEGDRRRRRDFKRFVVRHEPAEVGIADGRAVGLFGHHRNATLRRIEHLLEARKLLRGSIVSGDRVLRFPRDFLNQSEVERGLRTHRLLCGGLQVGRIVDGV